MRVGFFCASLLLVAAQPFAAWGQGLVSQAGVQNDALSLLQKSVAAARHLNYVGTIVHQTDGHVETSRIVHKVDPSGEHERLEVLDGTPREVIRNNDEVTCYLSGGKTVNTGKRQNKKSFPALLPESLSNLADSYVIELGGRERVAGYECQVIVLKPKDDMRYGHKLWVDGNSGLLLKAMVTEGGKTVEQFLFTQITIGGNIDKAMLKPKYSGKNAAQTVGGNAPAKPEEASPPGASALNSPVQLGWQAKNLPPGFKKIMEMKRNLPGKPSPVGHLVYSDGLAAVSVFIEPTAQMYPAAPSVPPLQGLSPGRGAINVFTRTVGDSLVTVVGETPQATVMQIGNSVFNSASGK